jgi:hypothetical protein
MKFASLFIRFCSVLILALLPLSGVASEARIIHYFGYDDCIELSNATCRVVLTPAVGGKVMSYSLDGKEALNIFPEEAGFRYDPSIEQTYPTSGGRFDIGLEGRSPPHPELWVGPWEGEIIGPREARMTSLRHDATGLQLVRDFKLDAEGTRLSCTQTLINISSTTQRYFHWGRTFAKAGGIVIIPLSEWSRYPNHYVALESRYLANLAPEDPKIYRAENHLIITGPPTHAKMGMDSMESWFTYLMPNDLMFVKQYPVYPERNYSERVPMTLSIWYKENYRMTGKDAIELEPIGPLETLGPGDRASFTEEWYLLPFAFPADVKNFDIQTTVEAAKTVLSTAN